MLYGLIAKQNHPPLKFHVHHTKTDTWLQIIQQLELLSFTFLLCGSFEIKEFWQSHNVLFFKQGFALRCRDL
jgi:hypothetical protein